MLPLLLSDLTNAGKKERRAIKRFPLKGSTTFLTNSIHNSAASFRAETNPPSVSIQAGPQNLFPRVTNPSFHFIIIKAATMTRSPLVHDCRGSGVILLMQRLKSGAKCERTTNEQNREGSERNAAKRSFNAATDLFEAERRRGKRENERS